MIAEKARCFGDNEALTKVLQTTSPAEAKKVGRSVEGYRESTWADLRFQAVVQGNLFKFGSSKPLRYFLLGTGKKILVEASILGGIDLGRLDVTLLLATLTITLSASPHLTCRPKLVRDVEGRVRELVPDRFECLMAGLR